MCPQTKVDARMLFCNIKSGIPAHLTGEIKCVERKQSPVPSSAPSYQGNSICTRRLSFLPNEA